MGCITLIGSSSDPTGRLAGGRRAERQTRMVQLKQAPRRHSRLPPPRPLSHVVSTYMSCNRRPAAHHRHITYRQALEPRTYELIPPIPIHLPFLLSQEQHFHHSLLLSSPRAQLTTHTLPAIPSRSLSPPTRARPPIL
jgi:hypothetical protein